MRNDGVMTATLIGGLSFGLLCASLGGLLSSTDRRLDLTYSETFSGLDGIRDLFLATRNYTVLHNPFRVDHVRFPGSPELREDLEDLQRRGLFVGVSFNFTDPNSNSLLHQLMRASWCSSGVARTDMLPAQRNPGCRCISDAYLALIRDTLPANASNFTLNAQNVSVLTIVNVPANVSRQAGDRVYRCWDQRQVTRTRHCGAVCTTHVGALALFGNIVLFLVCAAFVAFRVFDGWNPFLTKGFIVVLGVVLSIAYMVENIEANALTLGGLGVCLFYLTVTLHEELSFPQDEPREGPHPLIAALMVNLPLIMSAHTIQIGVSGYGRDMWAFASFGFCGGLLGTVAQVLFLVHHGFGLESLFFPLIRVFSQRYFWHSWYGLLMDESKGIQFFLSRLALNTAYVTLQILLLLLYVAYYYLGAPYAGNNWALFWLYQTYLTVLPWILSRDYLAMIEQGAFSKTDELTFPQACVLVFTLGANVLMTFVALVDLF